MLHATSKVSLTAGSDRDAVEAWETPDGRAKVWFDTKGRVCKLEIEQAGTLDVELTPGVTSDPNFAQLIRDHDGDPAEWAEACMASHSPSPRSRGRPSGRTWPTIILALSVFFEVKRLEYLKVEHPQKAVRDNRGKPKLNISRLCRLAETILAA